MKKMILHIIIFLFLTGTMYGQALIGLSKDKILKIMKEESPDFFLNTSTVNKHFNYLKYENEEGTQTMLIFLDDEDKCKYYKKIYDYVHLPELTVRLKNSSRKKNDTLWVKKINDQTYLQFIEKQEWFFTVTTRLEKK